MFKNKENTFMPESTPPVSRDLNQKESNEITRIAPGAHVRGDLICSGSAVIDGRVEGSCTAQGDIQIGSKGDVTGEVEGKNITVIGRLKGKLYADEKSLLQSGAHVEADIHAQSLKIDDSVFFQGGCNMGEGARKRRADTRLNPVQSTVTELKKAS
jgi:cytoskeletal protein CcmA (bactofilin family)